jgi:cholesterol oxidase
MSNFDVIIIGSGFGGAITACRLAEQGYRVLVLERGRRWQTSEYPSVTKRDWVWDNNDPVRRNGWIDLRLFPGMSVIQGAAVGGGSLIYANISAEAPPQTFAEGWPEEITYAELKPYYDRVGAFMNVQPVPVSQWPPRTRIVQEAATKSGDAGRFRPLELAVTFDPNLPFNPDAPPIAADSRPFTNPQGVQQGHCVHLGVCDAGCPVEAKNTLERNYIPQAERHGAEVRPGAIVRRLMVDRAGYQVSYDELRDGRLIARAEQARIVIVAAGSLGSTELLLRCRDEYRTLPAISQALGTGWSSNGDVLTPALHNDGRPRPSLGPTITAAIDYLDGSVAGQRFWIQDGGIPDLLRSYSANPPRGELDLQSLLRNFGRDERRLDLLAGIMPWFAQGVDAADGRLQLRRPFWTLGLFGKRQLHLDWRVERSAPVFEAILGKHEQLSRMVGGRPILPPSWKFARQAPSLLVTPHPLGGCRMARTPALGVVDHRGEVFGYRNLFVSDGAIIPTALGVNPSRTIGALAERIAATIANEGR